MKMMMMRLGTKLNKGETIMLELIAACMNPGSGTMIAIEGKETKVCITLFKYLDYQIKCN